MPLGRPHPSPEPGTTRVLCPQCRAVNRLPADRPAEKAKCGSCHQPLFTGAPIAVDEAGFNEHLRQNEIPVLVDMWAPWCGPCRMMAPMFAQAALSLEPEMRLLKLNVDEAQQTAGSLGVRGIPALLLFRRGRALGLSAGVKNTETIIRWARDLARAPGNT